MNFPRGGGNLQLKSQSAKISDNVHGGGYSATEKSQSTKIYLNMNFAKGGGVFWSSLGILYGFSLCVTSSILFLNIILYFINV